ncbi:MAG: hypothetical protein R2832_14255 [Rhodothermales bacterium]
MQTQNVGRHELSFETGDLPSGVYIVKLSAESTIRIAQVVVAH